MISKIVEADSFYYTCRYICVKPGMVIVQAEGVREHDYKLMATDFETQAMLRPEKQKACLHAILSFYPGEKLSDEKMLEIANRYLAELKIINTQIAIIKHTDKAHLHLHIMANMVNNEGKSITSSWIGLRGKKISQGLTREYKLVQAQEKNLKLTHLESLNEFEATKYKIYMAIAENLPKCSSPDELEWRLQKLGIGIQYKLKGQTQERQGISFKMGDYSFKGSQVDRHFSIRGLEQRMELNFKQSLAQSQKESLLLSKEERGLTERWNRRQLREKLNMPSVKNRHTIASDHLPGSPLKGLKNEAHSILTPHETGQPLNPELNAEEQHQKKRKKLRHRLL